MKNYPLALMAIAILSVGCDKDQEEQARAAFRSNQAAEAPVAAVPEPSSALVFAVGGLLVAARMRRRR